LQGSLLFDPHRLRYVGQLLETGEVVIVNDRGSAAGELRFLSFAMAPLGERAAIFGFEVLGHAYDRGLNVRIDASAPPGRLPANSNGPTAVLQNSALAPSGSPRRMTTAAWASVLGSTVAGPGGPLAVPPAGGYTIGDCSLDAAIDVLDPLAAARISVGLDAPPANPSDLRVCDVDGSGVVNVLDVLDIAHVSVGNDPPLGGPVGVAFRSVSVGVNHSCALDEDGQAYCWGANASGQLGDGTTTDGAVPRAVSGGHTFVQIALGGQHSCGLDDSGGAWCWGAGAAGQVGDGAVANRTGPVAVSGGHSFVQLAAGGSHTCGVDEAGEAWCWGGNGQGQLGDGTTVDRATPVPLSGLQIFAQIAGGYAHSCGLAQSGGAFCWGDNAYGQLGDGGGPDALIPSPVLGPHTFVQLATGDRHTCAVYATGEVWCWGGALLGNGSPTGSPIPVAGSGTSSFVQVAAGLAHSCALSSAGQGYCWGENSAGELGDGTTTPRLVPAPVTGGHTLVDIAASSGAHTCALDDRGRALCWGDNGFGQLGDGSLASHSTPFVIPPLGCSLADPLDTDGDRLPDCVETGTGVFLSELDTGTDPFAPDTDGDGIEDGDETLGTLMGLDLPALGASPLRKDVLIEYDWFDDALECAPHSHRPGPAAVTMVAASFTASPVVNPDGSFGVNVIHDYGQGGVFTGGNLLYDADGVLSTGVNGVEFAQHKAANFDENRVGYFRYVLLPHRYNTSSSSSGQAELVGDDMIVSLYCFGTDENVAHTVMHELGHNLGLHHGGFEALNWKPNYNSVMNYRYAFPGVDTNCDPVGDGVLDFSRGTRLPLSETSLDERLGVCGNPPGPGWDWTGDGDALDVGVVRDINVDQQGFGDGYLQVLTDYDDWGSLVFGGLTMGEGPAMASRTSRWDVEEIITCTPLSPPG
jgi:alpha-tubulin suppressor-like RCC1 family protein